MNTVQVFESTDGGFHREKMEAILASIQFTLNGDARRAKGPIAFSDEQVRSLLSKSATLLPLLVSYHIETADQCEAPAAGSSAPLPISVAPPACNRQSSLADLNARRAYLLNNLPLRAEDGALEVAWLDERIDDMIIAQSLRNYRTTLCKLNASAGADANRSDLNARADEIIAIESKMRLLGVALN